MADQRRTMLYLLDQNRDRLRPCRPSAPMPTRHAPLHNLIRSGVVHSANFRKAAVKMDDVFYGKKPNRIRPRNGLNNPEKSFRRISQTGCGLIRFQQHIFHPMFPAFCMAATRRRNQTGGNHDEVCTWPDPEAATPE